MTLAVIMTMWVSLSLFGAGLLASQQVDLMKGKWYDKIEISIFLCAKDTAATSVTRVRTSPRAEGRDPSNAGGQSRGCAGRNLLRNQARGVRGVPESVRGQPDPGLAGCGADAGVVPCQAQESGGVPGCGELGGRAQGRPEGAGSAPAAGSFFRALNVLQWSTAGASAAAAACISPADWQHDPIGDLARRREIGIMRAWSAQQLYITVPFLLER